MRENLNLSNIGKEALHIKEETGKKYSKSEGKIKPKTPLLDTFQKNKNITISKILNSTYKTLPHILESFTNQDLQTMLEKTSSPRNCTSLNNLSIGRQTLSHTSSVQEPIPQTAQRLVETYDTREPASILPPPSISHPIHTHYAPGPSQIVRQQHHTLPAPHSQIPPQHQIHLSHIRHPSYAQNTPGVFDYSGAIIREREKQRERERERESEIIGKTAQSEERRKHFPSASLPQNQFVTNQRAMEVGKRMEEYNEYGRKLDMLERKLHLVNNYNTEFQEIQMQNKEYQQREKIYSIVFYSINTQS